MFIICQDSIPIKGTKFGAVGGFRCGDVAVISMVYAVTDQAHCPEIAPFQVQVSEMHKHIRADFESCQLGEAYPRKNFQAPILGLR